MFARDLIAPIDAIVAEHRKELGGARPDLLQELEAAHQAAEHDEALEAIRIVDGLYSEYVNLELEQAMLIIQDVSQHRVPPNGATPCAA